MNKATDIFVFGSNTAGVHGAGAAKTAYEKYGARWGKGLGHYGNSFALPTKDHNIQTLPMHKIEIYVKAFMQYAEDHKELDFMVTRVGCGLAGLHDQQIACMFDFAPANCFFDTKWEPLLPSCCKG